jgi:integrase
VNIEPNLLPLLRVLVDQKKPMDHLLVVRAHNRCATKLRADLLKAGVTRTALHVETEQTAHLTFHNLKDTCGTHMAVRRDPPQDIQWRLAHKDAKTTEIYIGEARYAAGANFGEPLAPLPPDLLTMKGGATLERRGRPLTSREPRFLSVGSGSVFREVGMTG